MMNISDPEVQVLAGISAVLQAEYASEETAWIGSPFAWIKTRPSRQVGAIGEKLVAGWLAARDFNVARSPDSDADRIIENMRVEIKFSTLWKTGLYKFQQLRDQRYELVICLGVSPFSAHCWAIPKTEILHQWREGGGLSSQHGGAAGSDTAWLSVIPGSEPDWLQPFGGTLSDGLRKVAELTGFTGIENLNQ